MSRVSDDDLDERGPRLLGVLLEVRADVRARDVIILISWLSRLDDAELDERAPRLLTVLLAGLSTPTR